MMIQSQDTVPNLSKAIWHTQSDTLGYLTIQLLAGNKSVLEVINFVFSNIRASIALVHEQGCSPATR